MPALCITHMVQNYHSIRPEVSSFKRLRRISIKKSTHLTLDTSIYNSNLGALNNLLGATLAFLWSETLYEGL